MQITKPASGQVKNLGKNGEKIISAAKRIAPQHKALFKERREQIKQYRAQQLREKAAEILRKRRREEQER